MPEAHWPRRHRHPNPNPAPAPPPTPVPVPTPVTGAKFFDDFTGSAGSAPSSANWVVSNISYNDDPTAGAANYTASTANVYQDGNSHLIIAVTATAAKATAVKTPSRGSYESARLGTFDTMNGGDTKFAQSWGTFSASIKVTPATGFWPAFWTTGTNITEWPYCGECDILENYGTGGGGQLDTSYATVHGPMSNGNDYGYAAGETPATIESGFHVYSMTIPENYSQVSFAYDGTTYATITKAEWMSAAGNGATWPYSAENAQGFILNVDVGSNVDAGDVGFPAASQVFPANVLEIDWVQATQP
jgi:beta-glucanase (GH16 family)